MPLSAKTLKTKDAENVITAAVNKAIDFFNKLLFFITIPPNLFGSLKYTVWVKFPLLF